MVTQSLAASNAKRLSNLPMKITRWLLIYCLVALGCSSDLSNAETEVAARDSWIAQWENELANGENHLALYSTKNTNVLLSKISGNPRVEFISIRQTLDLSQIGLSTLPTFANLSKLIISGEKSLNDKTLHYVTDCANLESLELECTAITSGSFSSIAKLAKLTSLNIETCNSNEKYTDADVLSLGELKRLRYLNLNGAASPDALRSLRDQLPDCWISQARPATSSEQPEARERPSDILK